MARWSWVVELDEHHALPVFLQIARAIAVDIRRGRLRPGAPLPGTRELAAMLGVNRNTVSSAYSELRAEGWLKGGRGSRVCVTDALPEPAVHATTKPAGELGFDLEPAPEAIADASVGPKMLKWDFGMPDARLVPTQALARAFRRATRNTQLLEYDRDRTRKVGALQQEVAAMLTATRGLVVPPEQVVLTRGSHMALSLVAQALLRSGDVVAIEQPGFYAVWDTFRRAGAQLAPIDVDGSGMRVEQLERLVAGGKRLRAVFVTPHHQFPTGVPLSPGRRIELVRFAQRHRVAIIEDDFDPDFHYDGRPLLPLAAMDAAGVVVYCGSLSKTLSPAVRVGYAVAPPSLARELERRRRLIDPQRDELLDAAVAELIEDGELQRHVNRARKTYRARRDHLAALLKARLGDALSFDVPAGGLALWTTVDRRINVEAWAARALESGLQVRTGRIFWSDGAPRQYLRLGFARLNEGELERVVERLRGALKLNSRVRAS